MEWYAPLNRIEYCNFDCGKDVALSDSIKCFLMINICK